MSNKRKRHVLSMEQKIEILAKLDKGETSVSLARIYNIGKATVTDIKNNRHAIMDFASKMNSDYGIKRKKVMRITKYHDLDKAMEMWFIQKRSLNEPISGPYLKKLLR
ncbi:jerky protein homolog-like [Sipha flava]|uniref:Jerky protein homolog-like n=1 Tax=Sipha flava TaxID=143950 RepID=A0A8B8FGB7_9HEMI|nr:jerky protein homolog-like [Sipha flava]